MGIMTGERRPGFNAPIGDMKVWGNSNIFKLPMFNYCIIRSVKVHSTEGI